MFDAYEFALKSPLLFYRIPEADELRRRYSDPHRFVSCAANNSPTLRRDCEFIMESLAMSLKLKYLDKEILCKAASPAVEMITGELTANGSKAWK